MFFQKFLPTRASTPSSDMDVDSNSAIMEDFKQKLLEVLNYPQIRELMLDFDPDDLSDEERLCLDCIYRHLCVDEEGEHPRHHRGVSEPTETEADPETSAAADSTATPKSARRKSAPREAEMAKLYKNLMLEEQLAEVLQDEMLMAHPKLLFSEAQLPVVQVDILIGSNDVGGAFHSCYDFIVALDAQSSLNKVLWAFFMRFMYKLVALLNPKLTGRRFGPKMKVAFDAFIQQIFTTDVEREQASKNADEWCLIGLKIDTLCAEFGSGCILYLARHFSKDFFLNKYRESGKVKETVFRELHSRGLKEMAAESGANQLCDKVDEFLISGFQEFFAHQR